MLDMAQKALEMSAGKDRAAYDEDETLRLALTHIIQIIGEAAQRVTPEFRQKYSHVPWQEIIGMRHRIVHDYLNIDEDVIREVLKQHLPPLAKTLQAILPPGYN